METPLRWLTGVSLVTLICSVAAAADDDQSKKKSGRVLVLQSERTVSGQIERVGDRYRIRRDVGETFVPAENVLYLCDSFEDAFSRVRMRANLNDADERMRLARWCLLHGLRQQATEEAKAAVAIQPENSSCQRLLDLCRRTPSLVSPDTAIKPVSAEIKVEREPNNTSEPEISPEHMSQFVKRVQPILMNACVACHSTGEAGGFKLTRTVERGVLNRSATQRNLSAVLSQLKQEAWESSPLLQKAVTAHGSAAQPPLKSRQTAAFRTVEEWVRVVLADGVAKQPRMEPKPLPEQPPMIGLPSGFADVPEPKAIAPAQPATQPLPLFPADASPPTDKKPPTGS